MKVLVRVSVKCNEFLFLNRGLSKFDSNNEVLVKCMENNPKHEQTSDRGSFYYSEEGKYFS